MMAPLLPVPVTVATNCRLHKRDDYDGPNLAVLIPVIVILTLIAVFFFGWLGVPWPKIMAWWKRKRTRAAATSKDHHDHDQELQHQSPSGRAEPQPQPQPQPQSQPGSRLSYAKAFERSHIDALKLPSVGADPKPKTAKEPGKHVMEGEEPNRPPTRASTEAPPSGSLTPDLAAGQMTPGQQSTLSAVPERRASPWDPTRNPD